MEKVLTKHFQYSGSDDFDEALDTQVNEFLSQENISAQDIIDIKYEGHSALGVHTYSAFVIYKSAK